MRKSKQKYFYLLYALAIQFLSLHFSLSLLLLSLAASGVILILCIRYFKKQDSIMEDANDQITRILSGQRDERIDCNEEGELYCLFQSVNTLSAVLDAQMDREKQTSLALSISLFCSHSFCRTAHSCRYSRCRSSRPFSWRGARRATR